MNPPESNRAATLRDVAALVGVSPRTVSRVVNDEGGFSDETRDKVLEAVEQLGYRPNVFARGLITRRSRTVAFVATTLDDPFFPEVAQAVQRAARAAGLTMLLAVNEHDPELEVELLEQMEMYAPEGVIVFPAAGDAEHLRPLLDRGVATVVVDTPLDHDRAALLVSDLVGAGRIAVEHLIGRGCRRPAMLTNDQLDVSSDPRQQGFVAACRHAGIDEPTVVKAPATTHGGRQGMALALEVVPDLDAIFAYNDVMAIGAMQALTARGIRMPDDVAVIGCDDIALNTMVTPTLSSVRNDRKQIGQEAVRLLGALVDGRRFDEPTVVPVELVSRQSG